MIINSGSATLKFKVFSALDLSQEINGIVERIGLRDSFLVVKSVQGEAIKKYPRGIKNHSLALKEVTDNLSAILPEIKLVGHRVVHGGGVFQKPLKLDKNTINKLEQYNKLAPLHNPINLSCASAALKLLPQAKHWAVFDTAYYYTLPDYAKRYALPEKFYNLGIRRYGFHGLSHKYSAILGAKKAKLKISQAKIITCHLGSGSSLTATKNGEAIDTTMGFTPLSGLIMSTRAGDLDAYIPLYMIDELKMKSSEINDLLNKKSGLLGLAGTTDMREILSASGKKVLGYKAPKNFTAKQKADSKLALAMFIYSIVGQIGRLSASLGGVDLITFSGGIGERSPVVREMILKQIKFLGSFKSVVVEANEELMIASEISGK